MRLFVALIIIFWGCWNLFEKIALFYGTPWQTIFAFLIWTALLFLPFTIVALFKKQGKNGFKISKLVWFWIFLAVFTDLVALLAFRYSLLMGSTGIVVAATSVYPIVTIILSAIFLKEKISKWQYLGVGIVCLGLFLLSL
jgi:transporter family protein